MNRISTSPTLPGPRPQHARGQTSSVESGAFPRVNGDQPLSLFTPLHYEPNYAYPLIVWLHGSGQDETHLRRIMPLISLRNYAGIGIRGSVGPLSPKGYAWSQSQSHVALAEQRVFDAMATAQEKINISPRRIFLAGFGDGGTMAFRLAMAHPHSFAGVLSFGGEFPLERSPLARLVDARQLPIWLSAGRDSQSYPSQAVCDNLRLLHSAGMNITLRQYPCGQELSPQMLSDMDHWLMQQITGTSSSHD